ncbi:MAG: hypothetical protein JSS09_07500 [Verrucomicrobia bacterium]|nr:hypothetical protein [Verrucomicrobiota bacterium]
MIPTCCAVSANVGTSYYSYYFPNSSTSRNYYSALEKAHKETPEASCQEQIITGIALSAIAPPCCFKIPASPLITCVTTPLFVMGTSMSPLVREPGFPDYPISNITFSSGIVRDCVLIHETFKTPTSHSLPTHRND